MAAVVHLRSVVALLGRFPVLAGVDLDVAAGEVVLVEAPNGAGKTSLLRACAGLLPISAGEAVVLGADLRRDRRSHRRRLAFLGHENALYEDLTALENVRFGLAAAGRDPAAAGAVLARAGIAEGAAALPTARLSQGQRRRVALASLAARAADLLLLDEPHAGLDEEGRAWLGELVADAARNGAGVLLASHEHDAARPLASRRVALVGGRIASPASRRRPVEREAAGVA